MLLTLPPELVAQIISFLPPADITTCTLVNTQLRTLITTSAAFQYTLALSAARAHDNPLCIDAIAAKLQSLRNSEAAWNFLDVKQQRKVRVTYQQSGVYDLSAGIYLLSNEGRRRLYTIDLNSLTPNTGRKPAGEEVIKWKKVESERFIVDLGLCVYEHDLIALVTTAPRHTPPGEQQLHEISIDIRQLSTDTPHPRAKNPTIWVMNSRYEKPAIGIEIVGKHLVLILTFNHQDRPLDRVFIYQWMEGVLIASFEAKHRSYSGLLFLDTSLICLPNTNGQSLDIFRIPDAPTLESPKPIIRLGLPKLVDGRMMGVISCRAEPNPVHPDSFAEMREHSACMRAQASNANLDAKYASTSASGSASTSAAAPNTDEPNVTHDASKIPLGQAFQRATVADSEHALCLFELHILVLQLVMVPGGGLNMHFQFRHRVAFVSPRSALLAAVHEHEKRLEVEAKEREEKKRVAQEKKAKRDAEKKEREEKALERKRKRAMEAGPSRARANSPSVQEFVRARDANAASGSADAAEGVFGRTDWPPADTRVDDDHDDIPYVPFGDRDAASAAATNVDNQHEGEHDNNANNNNTNASGAVAGPSGAASSGLVTEAMPAPTLAVTDATATRTDVAGPSGETSTVVGTGTVEHGPMPGGWVEEEMYDPIDEENLDDEIFQPIIFPGVTHQYVFEDDSDHEDDSIPGLDDTEEEDDGADDDANGGGGDAGHIFAGIPGLPQIPNFPFGVRREGPADRTLVPWKKWSGGRTRWFNSDSHITHWITTSAGERLVRMADHTAGPAEEEPSDDSDEEGVDSDAGATNGSVVDNLANLAPEHGSVVAGMDEDADDSDAELAAHMRSRRGAPFAVLDFNPLRVAAMRRWVEKQKHPVVRGLRRPPNGDGDDEDGEDRPHPRPNRNAMYWGDSEEEDVRDDVHRDPTYVASDGEAPTLGSRADGSLRRQRNVRKAGRRRQSAGGEESKADRIKGKGKAKEPTEEDLAWERKKRKHTEHQHVVGVWRVHESKRAVQKGKEKEKKKPNGAPVPTFITADVEEIYNIDMSDSEPVEVLSTGYAELVEDEHPPTASVDVAGPSTVAPLVSPDADPDADVAAQAMDEYLAQFDGMDEEDEYEAEEDAENDVEGDFMDFIEQVGDEQDEDHVQYMDVMDTSDEDEASATATPFAHAPTAIDVRPAAARQYYSTGGHIPAEPLLARPPPDSLWVVPAGDVFDLPQVFADPIINGLSYVMCTSRRRYTYDGIMLDEDRVIGTRANVDTGRIEFIDLHYFA